jgi:hypothetical protein
MASSGDGNIIAMPSYLRVDRDGDIAIVSLLAPAMPPALFSGEYRVWLCMAFCGRDISSRPARANSN